MVAAASAPDLLQLCQAAVEAARKAGADEAEAYAEHDSVVSARAEQNDLVGAESEESIQLGLRVMVKGAVGFCALNRGDEAAITEAARSAVSLARASNGGDDTLPDPRPIPTLRGLDDPGMSAGTVELAVERCHALLTAARGVDPRVSIDGAEVQFAAGARAVVSTRGVRAEERGTAASASVFGMAVDGDDVSGFDHEVAAVRALRELPGSEPGKLLGEKLLRLLGARPYDGPATPLLLFSPEALEEILLEPLFASMDGDAVRRGRSQLAGKLGQSVADARLSVLDDPTVDGDVASEAFDREGLGHVRTPLLDRGVLRTFLHNAQSARRMGQTPTGHASGDARSVPGIDVTRIDVSAGDARVSDLVAEVGEGIYVGRFAGSVDEVSGDFSGVVKSSFRIRAGQQAEALRETLISGNAFDLLQRICGVSVERKILPGRLLPHVLTRGATVTGGGD
ncbi:MAG: TldD/PmbA family protein [Myxococcota bacterium]